MRKKPDLANDQQFRRLTLVLSIANTMSGELSRKDMPFEYTKLFNVLHKELEQQLAILYATENVRMPPSGALTFSSITRTWAEANIFPGFGKKTKAPDMGSSACSAVGSRTDHARRGVSCPIASHSGENARDKREVSPPNGGKKILAKERKPRKRRHDDLLNAIRDTGAVIHPSPFTPTKRELDEIDRIVEDVQSGKAKRITLQPKAERDYREYDPQK